MSTYRAAIVGCGGRSRPHVQAYERIDNAEVVACCDLTPARREKLAAEFGITAYADAAEMIRAEKPDIVHLATWPATRVELMTLVSDLGVGLCTVEKPIATGVADWRALRALEAAGDTKFAVCHQFRWQRHMVKCQQALASGKLGKVMMLDMSAGMNISGQGTHILNYAMGLNGESPVVRVFGSAAGAQGMTGGHPGPDDTVGYLTFANGARALWVNGATARRCGDPETDWQHVRVSAHAEWGRTKYEEFGRWEIASADGVEEGDFGDKDTWWDNNLEAQSRFHKAMFRWLEGGAAPGTNLAQSLHEWLVVLALYASALQRRAIEIAEFDPPDDLFARLGEALAE